jgi:uncharacterized protein YcaQ
MMPGIPRRRPTNALSQTEARWLVLSAQKLSQPRPRGPISRRHIASLVEALGKLQVDAINVLERTHFLVLFSRLGAFDRDLLHDMSGPGGELFEYWAHAASLLPVSLHPLSRWRMARVSPYGDRPGHRERWNAWQEANGEYMAAVLDEVRTRGALAASQLSDPRRRDGEWWDRRSIGRVSLEWLFLHGELAAWRTPNFERVYDLPDRVLPPAVLTAPTPRTEEAHRSLLAYAARALGVGTARDLAGYYMIGGAVAKKRLAELVASGQLEEVTVEGWREIGYMPTGAKIVRPRRREAALLSPFDTLISDRQRALRVFGFDYRIEVYTPAPKRVYGYFVMPMLLGDRLVARLDLKADRKASRLVVNSAFLERGADAAEAAVAAAAELDVMRRWLGLESVAVAERGDLAAEVRRAVAGA